MKKENDYSMYEYLKMRDKGDNRPLISFYNTYIRTNDFFNEIDKVAISLYQIGVRKGDNIALCLPNIPNAIIIFYACSKLGVQVNLIHPLVPPNSLGEMITKLNSKVAFVFDMFFNKNHKVLQDLNIPVVVCGADDYLVGLYKFGYKLISFGKRPRLDNQQKAVKYQDFLHNNNQMVCPQLKHYDGIGEEVVAYIHSGGTTGEPKIVMLSNRAINECAYSIRTLIGDEVKKGESMLMVLPMFHIFGLGVCMHSTLTAGARCVLVPTFNIKNLARTIKKERVTYMTGIPSMYEKLAKTKSFGGKYLQEMKSCYCGGDKLKPSIKQDFDALMKKYGSNCTLCEGYGLTEAGVCNVNEECIGKKGSVGKPLGDIKVCIVDKNRNKLPFGQKGEICLTGDNLMSGYFEDEKTTQQVLFKDEQNTTWLATGDCGYLSESGHLFFVDRIKRMIKISGMNVFPSEIESVVYSNVIEIEKCCAVDEQIGGKTFIKLYITLKNGFEYNEKIQNKIIQSIKLNLMKYSLPREIVCVESLPTTPLGKIDYKQLKRGEVNDNKWKIGWRVWVKTGV